MLYNTRLMHVDIEFLCSEFVKNSHFFLSDFKFVHCEISHQFEFKHDQSSEQPIKVTGGQDPPPNEIPGLDLQQGRPLSALQRSIHEIFHPRSKRDQS